MNDIILQHKTTENILRAASTKDELLGLVSPDWQAIYWQEPETYLAEARKDMECVMTKWEWIKEIIGGLAFALLMAELYFLLWVLAPEGELVMVQQDLLEWPGDPGPNVHKNAKDTELAAAEFIAPKVTGLRLQALQSLASAQPGLTGSQVADRMGAWLYSVKPRLTELQRMGLVADSGERAKNERKRQEVVWKITDAGIEFLENMNG